MKKLLAAIAMGALIATSSFALTFKGSAGFAYGYSDIFKTQKSAFTIGSITLAEANYKTETINNSIGFKLQGTLGLTDNLGITLESSFLFPMQETLCKYTNLDNGEVTDDPQPYDGAFIYNMLLGPTYTFKPTKAFHIDATIGFDVGVNNYSTKLSESSTSTDSYALVGIGAKADAELSLSKHVAFKAGFTFGYLWATQYINVVTLTDGSDTKTRNYTANAIYLIPDVSLVYKF